MADDRETKGSSEQDHDFEPDYFRPHDMKPSPLKSPLKLPEAFLSRSTGKPPELRSLSPRDSVKSGGGKGRPWTLEEDNLLKNAASLYSCKNWKAIAKMVPGRSHCQCSQRWRRIQPYKMRQPWTKEEDKRLVSLLSQFGQNWSLISSSIEGRTGKQVRERWLNKLNPAIDRSRFSPQEDDKIVELYRKIGPKWKEISNELAGRTENMVKNRFYSSIKKNLLINCPEVYRELFEVKVKCEGDGQSEQSVKKRGLGELPEVKEFKEFKEFAGMTQNQQGTASEKLEVSHMLICPEITVNAQQSTMAGKNFTSEPFERLNFLAKKKEVLEGLLMRVMGQIQEHNVTKP